MSIARGSVHALSYNYVRTTYGDVTLGLYNSPIPASPTLATNSAAIVTKINSWAGPASLVLSTYNSVNDFDIPVYKAATTDPLFTISVDAASYPIGYTVQGLQIRIPDAAKAAGGSDGHMMVEDPNGGWVYEFWQVTSKPAGGGTLVASSGGRTRKRGPGFGNATATAGRIAPWMARPTIREMKSGHIGHAIPIIMKSTDGTNVWPTSGNAAAGDPTNAPPNGTWLQLNMTPAAIVALGLPTWKTGMLTAMSVYGAVVDDTGGSSWNMRCLSDASTASLGGATPLGTWAQTAASFSSGSPAFGDLKSGVTWSNFRVLDPAYMKGLYDARLATYKLDPIATISNNWTLTGGATAHACLTEATYPPFAATSTLRIGTSTTSNVSEVRVATPTIPNGKTIVGLVGWAYVNVATSTVYKMEIESGTTVLGTYSLSTVVGGQLWWPVEATTLAGLDSTDIRLKFTCTTGGTGGNIYAAHVMAEYG